MDFRKYIINLLIIVGFFIGVTFVSLWLYIKMNSLGICFMPAIVVVPIIGAAGVAIGSLAYYLLSEKMKVERNIKLFLNLVEDPVERKIIEHLLNKGIEKQSNLTKIIGNKVKVSRALAKLERKGLAKREAIGKIKLVKLVGFRR